MDILPFLFGATLDPTRYYPASEHEIISSKIIAGLREGESFQVVLGDFGSGKTTLAMRWLTEVGKQFDSIFLPAKRYPDSTLLLRDLNVELGLPPTEGIWNLRRQIEEHLLSGYEKKRNTILFVDGAHLLSDNSLLDLVSFTNFTGINGNAISLVLLGHDSLLDSLVGSRSKPVIKYHFPIEIIPPFKINELVDFARHQIRLEGLDPDHVIDADTLNFAGSLANGNIGLMTIVLRLSWRLARINEMTSVDIELVESAYSSICRSDYNKKEKVEEYKLEHKMQAISA